MSVRKDRKLHSPLWAYFSIIDRQNRLAKCDLCNQTMSYKATTTNLKMHLGRKHTADVDLKLLRTEVVEKEHSEDNDVLCDAVQSALGDATEVDIQDVIDNNGNAFIIGNSTSGNSEELKHFKSLVKKRRTPTFTSSRKSRIEKMEKQTLIPFETEAEISLLRKKEAELRIEEAQLKIETQRQLLEAAEAQKQLEVDICQLKLQYEKEKLLVELKKMQVEKEHAELELKKLKLERDKIDGEYITS